jgi:hypothetical protein
MTVPLHAAVRSRACTLQCAHVTTGKLMKTAFFAITLSAALMGSAFAAPQGGQESAAQAAPAGSYEPTVNEFDDYAKTFMLEDGRRITFSQTVTHYYVQLQGEKKEKLLPQAPGLFMTASGVRIQFRDDGDTVSILGYDKLAIRNKTAAGAMVMAKR